MTEGGGGGRRPPAGGRWFAGQVVVSLLLGALAAAIVYVLASVALAGFQDLLARLSARPRPAGAGGSPVDPVLTARLAWAAFAVVACGSLANAVRSRRGR